MRNSEVVQTNLPFGLRRIEVNGLFGHDPFVIEIDADNPTVITGANGSGKSTLLRLISALSNGDFFTLSTAPIERLGLVFWDLPELTMQRDHDSGGFLLQWDGNTGHVGLPALAIDLPGWAQVLLEDHNFDVELALRSISDYASQRSLPFEEYRQVRDQLSELSGEEFGRVPSWLEDFGQKFPVLFVTDQRLVRESRSSRSPTKNYSRNTAKRTSNLAVEAAGAELAASIQAADSAYARTSQQKDRSFPQHLIKMLSSGHSISLIELDQIISDVSNQREKLRLVGLLDDGAQYEPELTEETLMDPSLRVVMHAVLRSTLDKLAVLRDLEERLSAFRSFLDVRFAPKRIELNRDVGMRFSTIDGGSISPRQLSSGEQQMTVMAYEILFRANPRTLVIIDEPEISLHITWQDTLIDDLGRMGSAAQLNFLLATHSPAILAGHSALERALPGAKDVA